MKRLVRLVCRVLLRRIDPVRLEKYMLNIIRLRMETLTPAEAMRFLLRLDTALYGLEGKASVAYGNGVHTKHRHMGYHDFFVSRIDRGASVLDVGCGNGALAYDLADKQGARVTGIDMNEVQIQFARQHFNHPQITYLVGDALQKLPSGSFDTVVLSNVLEHVSDRVVFLKKIILTAQPGQVLIRVPLFERDWRVPLKKELGLEWRLDATHATEYTQESFAEEMTSAGLGISHQELRWGELWAECVPLKGIA